jgi:hypothetical protein
MRVFADANILFSAADPRSASRLLLDILFRHASVVTNEHVWEEARRNTELKRPALAENLAELKPKLHFTALFTNVDDVALPDKDRPVIGGAVASRCTHLWTGDKRHFGSFYGQSIRGTLILSGGQLADELERKGWLP